MTGFLVHLGVARAGPEAGRSHEQSPRDCVCSVVLPHSSIQWPQNIRKHRPGSTRGPRTKEEPRDELKGEKNVISVMINRSKIIIGREMDGECKTVSVLNRVMITLGVNTQHAKS